MAIAALETEHFDECDQHIHELQAQYNEHYLNDQTGVTYTETGMCIPQLQFSVFFFEEGYYKYAKNLCHVSYEILRDSIVDCEQGICEESEHLKRNYMHSNEEFRTIKSNASTNIALF
jgi:hypothetical protein